MKINGNPLTSMKIHISNRKINENNKTYKKSRCDNLLKSIITYALKPMKSNSNQ